MRRRRLSKKDRTPKCCKVEEYMRREEGEMGLEGEEGER
jgi:hypothetical protein